VKLLNFLLLFASISLSFNELVPDKDNAISLNELDIKCDKGNITYKISNTQSQKYFHLIKDTSITEFELHHDDNKLSYETSTTYDFFYPITPNHILYLVVNVQNDNCISFKYYDSNSINLKMNEEYSYPFLFTDQNIETTINNSLKKNLFIYAKTSSSFNFNFYINGENYSSYSLWAFYLILKENVTKLNIGIEKSYLKRVVNFTYIIADNFNLTDDTFVCNDDFSIFRTYFIKQKPNYSYFWYSLSSDKLGYYFVKRPQSELHNIIFGSWNNNYDYVILMRDKGCFQLKYQNYGRDISLKKKESILVSTTTTYQFVYNDTSKKDVNIAIYSTENNFINSIKIQGVNQNLEIKKYNDKYFYNFFSTNTNGEIYFKIIFNFNEKEYMIIDFEIDYYIPPENLIMNLKEEDNNKIRDIGNRGTFEILTDYNDTDTNIFNNSLIEDYTFDNTMTGDRDNVYNVKCRLWKSNNGMMKLFCKLTQELDYQTTFLIFSDTEFTFKIYTFKIKNYCNIPVNQIIMYIPFIYSEKQTINLDDGDILSFKFKHDLYKNEPLFLFDNNYKIVNFDNCLIDSNVGEIICQISNTKLKTILSFKGEKFYLGNMITDKVQNIFDSVEDIIITSDVEKKSNTVQITKLLSDVAEFNSFIYYETNILDINEFTSKFFDVNFQNFSSSCMFKKRADKNEPLLFICKTNQNETISFGKRERKIINNINIENNFIISAGNNYEIISVKGNGGSIYSVYPLVLDFTEEESLQIKIGFYGNLAGIKLNPDSKNELDCEQINNYLDCSVPKSHFDNKETGYYNIYYKNHLSKYSIKYEAPLIYVIIFNEKEEETDSSTEEEEKTDSKTEEEEETNPITEEEKEHETTIEEEENNPITEEEEHETKKEEEETNPSKEEGDNYNPSQETDDNNNNDNTALIIISVLVPIGIIIIILSVFFILRWKKRNGDEVIDNKQYEMIPKTESMSN